MEEEKLVRAREVFDIMCQALDAKEIRYSKDEEGLAIMAKFTGEDLPMDLIVRIKPELDLILLTSQIPYKIPADKRVEAAAAVGIVNSGILDGCFDFDLTSGSIYFRMTASYLETEISEDLFAYMLYVSAGTIDEFNDKFMKLGMGLIELKDFLSSDD